MKETKLLNCPFCGGEAEILEHDNGWAIWHCIICKNCKASQEWRKGYTKEEAIAAWNTRKPMERILEHLKRKKNPTLLLGSSWLSREERIWKSQGYCKAFEEVIEIVKEEGGIRNE